MSTDKATKTDGNLPIFSVSGSFLLRIALSPFIFLWGVFMLAAGTLFPLPLLVMFSVGGLIGSPIVWLLRKSGSDINYPDPFIPYPCETLGEYEMRYGENVLLHMMNHFFGATIYVWGAFAVAYHYIKTGEVFTGGD